MFYELGHHLEAHCSETGTKNAHHGEVRVGRAVDKVGISMVSHPGV